MTTKLQTYDNYKPSGVEWLGEIPEHWVLARLGILLTPISTNNRTDLALLSITREKGVILRDLDNEGENHNFIPDDLSNYKVLRKGQFGMNKMKAWQGSYGVSDYDGIVSPAYFIFDLDKKIEPKYFHSSIRSKLYVSFFGSASDGVRIGQWDLSKERMKQIPFLIPPIQEQTAIAHFLDDKTTKIDQAIGIKQKQIELLKERRQILIHKAVTRGLNDTVKFKDSGVEWIGEIPEGWEVAKIKQCSEKISKGTTPSTEGREILHEGEIRFLKSENIFEGFITEKPLFYIDKKTDFIMKRSSLQLNDVLFVIAGASLGKVAVVTEEFLPANTNQAVAFVRPNNKIHPGFLSKFLVSNTINELTWLEAVQSAQPNLSMESLGNFPIALPPIEEQKQIVEYIETATTKIATAISLKEQEIDKLKEYKMSLIDGVVTGKVRVS